MIEAIFGTTENNKNNKLRIKTIKLRIRIPIRIIPIRIIPIIIVLIQIYQTIIIKIK